MCVSNEGYAELSQLHMDKEHMVRKLPHLLRYATHSMDQYLSPTPIESKLVVVHFLPSFSGLLPTPTQRPSANPKKTNGQNKVQIDSLVPWSSGRGDIASEERSDQKARSIGCCSWSRWQRMALLQPVFTAWMPWLDTQDKKGIYIRHVSILQWPIRELKPFLGLAEGTRDDASSNQMLHLSY